MRKKKKIRKPSWFLITLLYLFIKPLYKIKHQLTIDKSGIADIQGPALVLSPHISGKDHFLQELALYPILPTYVLSTHFLTNPVLRFLLSFVRPISKKMFSSDVGTILNIMRAKEAGQVIIMFPEGRLTWYGHSGRITPGTAALVKKLAIPVYSIVSNGAYLAYPKWGLPRKGKIAITTAKILSTEQIQKMTVDEIDMHLSNDLFHNEETCLPGEKYRCKDSTKGLDNILYLCPSCGSMKTLYTKPNHICCSHCNMDALLNESYQFEGCRFPTINTWYDWQASQIDLAVDSVQGHAKINAVNAKGNLQQNAGEALVVLSKDGLSVEGTLFDSPLSLNIPADKLKAFPMTPGHHFDIYSDDTLINILPDDPRDTIRYVALCDALYNKNAGSN